MNTMTGHIHSIESFGTVDGPGVRLVVFVKGCPMRCQYCHNPDTWDMSGGTDMTVEEILNDYESNRDFYRNGGLTVTGGEPMAQMEFVTELFEAAKQKGIHTCLDTSGVLFYPENPVNKGKVDRLLDVTDLVMLDIKHIDPEEHQKLCAQPNANILKFAEYLAQRQIPVWIRHVVVPGITEHEGWLYKLGQFIGTLPNVKALDVLPYHDMGRMKYKELGIPYPLEGVDPLHKDRAIAAKKIILNGIRDERRKQS